MTYKEYINREFELTPEQTAIENKKFYTKCCIVAAIAIVIFVAILLDSDHPWSVVWMTIVSIAMIVCVPVWSVIYYRGNDASSDDGVMALWIWFEAGMLMLFIFGCEDIYECIDAMIYKGH